jgi:hypothetical protein
VVSLHLWASQVVLLQFPLVLCWIQWLGVCRGRERAHQLGDIRQSGGITMGSGASHTAGNVVIPTGSGETSGSLTLSSGDAAPGQGCWPVGVRSEVRPTVMARSLSHGEVTDGLG